MQSELEASHDEHFSSHSLSFRLIEYLLADEYTVGSVETQQLNNTTERGDVSA